MQLSVKKMCVRLSPRGEGESHALVTDKSRFKKSELAAGMPPEPAGTDARATA